MFRADLHSRRKFSCGTTLTELLVAMIILGGGMMTIAGMINQSLQCVAHAAKTFSANIVDAWLRSLAGENAGFGQIFGMYELVYVGAIVKYR